MENHIKMTKSFLQLLTKLESSIDTISTGNSSKNIRDDNNKELEKNSLNIEMDNSINITCNDIDNIYIELTRKDDLINKLKDIIICKNDKISVLIKDINEIKQKNDYLELKIIELTKTIKLLNKNIDYNTIIIDNK